ncbi:MAG: cytochrome ubiquinol oxidase subunit I [Verrucomicrobiales bacterium]|jgi:cytochrome d ubiquinol oxidase subunit I|nr:cytochrome ubiquinol oxidase subunit I [Verrucomicrobiales bacterium]
MDVEILARIQFAFTVAFQYIFPPLSIGRGVILVIRDGVWLKTRDALWHDMAKFWTKIFALTFAIGVASGIVMEFEFGTNWATYSRYVGDIFGSALAAEGIFAFFLESGFLAVLLFGWDKVGPKMHFFSTLMVAFGAHFSAVWIIVANSWQQTPAGFHIVGEGLQARAEITDFWAMVFNPSSVDRLSHAVSGAWLAGAFLVLSVSAWYLLKKKHIEFARASIKVALAVAVVASVTQLVTGHSSADGVAKNQPAKLAALEGHYQTGAAGMYVLGWVNDAEETVSGVKIPGMLSWFLHGAADAEVKGLDAFAREERPPVNLTFQFYHLMVGCGVLIFTISGVGALLWWRGTLFANRGALWVMVFAVLLPQIANQAGWFSAEIGRQPWIVYGLLRTSDALSKVVTAGQVVSSLALFALIYALLFAVFIYLLNNKIQLGPAADAGTDGGAGSLTKSKRV